ncbi:hypothetical protein DL764_000937 [Monosporascus ibericus]|uniref:Transcription factor domain-containing protein n=1 Tax=Monosporascus ibericus TaxID=155417 RepID=A0A4Q4TTA1_9PEZI|nr:hypothetical protein DL764_000937 [Monosporascus ibericus]
MNGTSEPLLRRPNGRPQACESPETLTSQIPGEQRPNPAITKPGYLGFTSFSRVYEETQNSLSLLEVLQGTPSPSCVRSPNLQGDGNGGLAFNRVREKCLAVLKSMPDAAQNKPLLRFYLSPMESWIYGVARHVLDSLYEEFGRYFRPRRDTAELEKVAHRLCVNTAQPFSDEENNPTRWIGQLCGKNLRWESLGILFAFWDLSRRPRISSQALMKDRLGRKGWDPVTQECLHLCLDLCKEFSNGNSVMLYLTWRRTVNESMFTGDAISFTGRPPLLCRRYTSTPLPLDIRDEDLFSDEATLAKTVDYVDDKGWNTRGEVYPSTFIRARALIASIREEIFEVALGHNHRTPPVETLLEIKAREVKTLSEFPSCLIYRPGDLADPSLDVVVLHHRLIIELENLQNMFFIERLFIRHGREDTGNLLAVSFDMVSLTLPFWTHLDRLAGIRADLEWLVIGYAAPAGGILSMELLKPTLPNGQHSDPRISRSSIIQKLSLLVGFLDWVNSSTPNGDLCSECKSVIQRVLDQTLNNTSSTNGFADGMESAGWDLPAQLDFNFDLLDTFDWLRPDAGVDTYFSADTGKAKPSYDYGVGDTDLLPFEHVFLLPGPVEVKRYPDGLQSLWAADLGLVSGGGVLMRPRHLPPNPQPNPNVVQSPPAPVFLRVNFERDIFNSTAFILCLESPRLVSVGRLFTFFDDCFDNGRNDLFEPVDSLQKIQTFAIDVLKTRFTHGKLHPMDRRVFRSMAALRRLLLIVKEEDATTPILIPILARRNRHDVDRRAVRHRFTDLAFQTCRGRLVHLPKLGTTTQGLTLKSAEKL